MSSTAKFLTYPDKHSLAGSGIIISKDYLNHLQGEYAETWSKASKESSKSTKKKDLTGGNNIRKPNVGAGSREKRESTAAQQPIRGRRAELVS
jgi:hypothetical protein